MLRGGEFHMKEIISPLESAIEDLTIFDLWQHFRLPGNPYENPCRSPFRQDYNPSFSVSANGKLFNDFASNKGGDLIRFVENATGLSRPAACRWLIEFHRRQYWGENRPIHGAAWATQTITQARSASTSKPLVPVTLPTLSTGSLADRQTLARVRNIEAAAVELAVGRGLIWFCNLENQAAWVATDQKQFNAQARRLDKKFWSSGS
jgi:hypothetical protein